MLWNKLERNRVYDAIRRNGVNPTDCKLSLTDDAAIITHNSGSVFQVALRADGVSRKRPIYDITTVVVDGPTRKLSTTKPFTESFYPLQTWASQIAAPDLWAELQGEREFIARIQAEDSDNVPFSQNEQGQIAVQLQEIKKQVRKKFELTNEQIAQIEKKLDEAAEASKRMGRKDWLIYVLGTITALIITATVAAPVGEHIFTMFIHALGHLFTAGSEPPQIPPPTIA